MGWFLEANFILIGIITILMAFGTLSTKKVMRAAAFLLLTLVGVALTYLFLGFEFLMGIQITVYAGGILILFLFSVLLTGHEEFKMDLEFAKENIVQILISILLFFTLTALMLSIYGNYQLTGNELVLQAQTKGLTQDFSVALFSHFNYVLPILGVLLFSAMLGSVKLVLREEEL